MWPPAPLEHPAALLCSALLCLRPTFLLQHTALAPHLIYTLEGEGVNAEKPAKKNLICSPSLKVRSFSTIYGAEMVRVMVFFGLPPPPPPQHVLFACVI